QRHAVEICEPEGQPEQHQRPQLVAALGLRQRHRYRGHSRPPHDDMSENTVCWPGPPVQTATAAITPIAQFSQSFAIEVCCLIATPLALRRRMALRPLSQAVSSAIGL